MDLETATTRDLLLQYAGILDELNRRRVVRSRNAPAGDLAETLVAAAYSGELALASTKSWDVRAADDRLLQVKCRVVDVDRPRGHYSPFRSWDFHACVFVLFDQATYGIREAVEVPEAAVRGVAHEARWVHGSRVSVGAALVRLDGAVDVTDRLSAALTALPAGTPAGDAG